LLADTDQRDLVPLSGHPLKIESDSTVRAVSAAHHTPIGGDKIPVPSPLSTLEKASIPQMEIWSTRNQWS